MAAFPGGVAFQVVSLTAINISSKKMNLIVEAYLQEATARYPPDPWAPPHLQAPCHLHQRRSEHRRHGWQSHSRPPLWSGRRQLPMPCVGWASRKGERRKRCGNSFLAQNSDSKVRLSSRSRSISTNLVSPMSRSSGRSDPFPLISSLIFLVFRTWAFWPLKIGRHVT